MLLKGCIGFREITENQMDKEIKNTMETALNPFLGSRLLLGVVSACVYIIQAVNLQFPQTAHALKNK